MEKENYEEFVNKFKVKKTTDDCYTPDDIMECVFNYVEKSYNLERTHFIRPFFPGGDYQNYRYQENDVVVDNPPFSILSEILDFYVENNIRFFIFAPAMVLLNVSSKHYKNICKISTNCKIQYENKAIVPTSFITNLETTKLRTDQQLKQEIEKFLPKKRKLKKYKWPSELLTISRLSKLKHDVQFYNIEMIRKIGNSEMFGGAYLCSKSELEVLEAVEALEALEALEAVEAVEAVELTKKEKEIIKHLDANDNM